MDFSDYDSHWFVCDGRSFGMSNLEKLNANGGNRHC